MQSDENQVIDNEVWYLAEEIYKRQGRQEHVDSTVIKGSDMARKLQVNPVTAMDVMAAYEKARTFFEVKRELTKEIAQI